MIDFMNIIARSKLHTSEDWEWCEVKAVDGGFILKGSCVFIKDGIKKWKKPLQTVIISDLDHIECIGSYEIETGKCSRCEGKGEEGKNWTLETGWAYTSCRRCKGTGKATVVPVSHPTSKNATPFTSEQIINVATELKKIENDHD